MLHRLAAPLLALLPALGVLSLAAQAPSPAMSPPTVTLQTTTRIVALDLAVTDGHGQPIEGLKASDFTLYEDGVPQTLTSFTEHDDAGATLPPPPQLPPNTFADHAPITGNGSITVILFDELSFADAAYAREEVAALMKTLKPGMPICIFKLDWQGLHLVQDFTTDPQVLRKAVTSKRNQQALRGPGWWLGYDPAPMRELASYLSGFPGRKNLIWFTDGIFPGDPSPNPTFFREPVDAADILKGTIDVLGLSRVAIYPIDARGLVVNPRRGFEVLSEDGQLAEMAAATGGRAFYSTNGFKQAVAEVVATGSHFYTLSYTPTNHNWNGSYRSIKIEVNPDNFPAQPKTRLQHVLDMRSTKPLLEYRRGYYSWWNGPRGFRAAAPGARKLLPFTTNNSANGPAAVAARQLHMAMDLGAVPPFQLLFQAHVTPSAVTQKLKRHEPRPKDNFLTADWVHHRFRNYQIHYSVDGDDIAFTPQRDGLYRDTLEFVAVVYDDQGDQVNSVATTVPLDIGPNPYLQTMRGGLGFDQTIALPTHGNFFLRLGIRDLASGRIGALEIPTESIKIPTESIKLPPRPTAEQNPHAAP